MKRTTVGAMLAILAMVVCCPWAQADSVSFSSSFLTDANQPFSGKATFTYTGLGTMTVTLTDTTVNPVSDAPNIADISFVIAGLTTGSVTGASGQTIANIVDNATPTLSNFSGASPWSFANATSSGWWTQVYAGSTQTFDLYAPAGATTKPCLANTAPYSIVGSPSSNGTYTNPNNPTIGSANLLTSGCDGTMFAGSVTFSLSITGLNATNFDTIKNVGFGLGPDCANKPDGDDVGGGTPVPVPEPSGLLLLGSSLSGAALAIRRRKK